MAWHARCTWDLDAWLATELSAEDRAMVSSERARAVARFGAAHDSGLDAEANCLAGLPDAELSRALHAGLVSTVCA